MKSPKTEITLTTTQTFVFGPYMTALNAHEKAFVIAWNNGGQKNAGAAVRQAGYSQHPASSYVTATRLLHNPRIQHAVIEDLKARMIGLNAQALNTVHQVMQDPQTPPASRIKAAEMVMNRAGLGATQVTEHNINVTLTTLEKLDRLRELAGTLRIDVKDLIGSVTDLDPAEYQEVPDDEGDGEEVTNSIPGLEGLV